MIVHLTPADEDTYKYLVRDLRARHRDEYRASRCMIPGQRKPLILCPDNNRCQECPYPEYRDKHQANQISYEQMIELGEEIGDNSRMIDQLESKMQYREIRQIMDREDSLITQVFEMKAFDDMPVKEIAAKLGITERQVYYLHSKALAIGQKYNQD